MDEHKKLFDSLSIGTPVKCSLNGMLPQATEFTGKVYYLDKKRYRVDIMKDLGAMNGGGKHGSWNTHITSSNYKYLQILIGDWDE